MSSEGRTQLTKESERRANNSRSDWRGRYSRRLLLLDAGVILWAVTGAYGVRFGLSEINQGNNGDADYIWLSAVLAVAWWLMLQLWGTREPKVLGSGTEE